MQHYLDQLIEDMHLAAAQVPPSKIPEGTFDPEYMLELEQMQDQPMSAWFGLSKEQFPPSGKLTSNQLELMVSEFEQLWDAYSFSPYFPEGLPARRRYELMREFLDQECSHWPGGWVQYFRFCNFEQEHCPFGQEFCMCKELDYDEPFMMDNSMKSEDDLPF